MIAASEINSCKILAEVLSQHIPGGVIFGYVEGDTATWVKGSSDMEDRKMLYVGIKADPVTLQCMRENKILTQSIPRSVYGMRLLMVSIPVVNELGEVTGSFSMAFPQLHPVAAAFDEFAPILAEMFHEGAFLYMTDLQKIAKRQPSEKFDMPSITVGYELGEDDLPAKAIKLKKPLSEEYDETKFGVPVFSVCYPLFDEEQVVAVLGIHIPKATAAALREMADNLENGLSSISSAIEELAASATEINTNEQSLNENINEITNISEQINEVSAFIKEIADETKMLGLNAAIEAARAGDAGRGFGVVAEEIRKLSDQSKSTVPKIQGLTDNIRLKVNEASDKSQGSLASSEEQAAATEEITANIEEITALSEELVKISKNI